MKKKCYSKGIVITLILLVFINSVLAFSLNGNEGDKKGFKIDKTRYEIEFYDLGERSIINVYPGNLNVILDIGQEKIIDVNNDGKDDFIIKMVSVLDKSASIEVIEIGKETKEEEEETKEEETEITPIITPITNKTEENVSKGIPAFTSITGNFIKNITKINMKIWYVVILVILILIVIAFVYKKGANAGRYYKKAGNLHREAIEFHEDGDEETAEELYEKAEEMREKARELEYK